ncbi:TetR/AcrR family transcriptional regulator [Companilactobacillus sp. HBUAS56257]|uniref:TetR/AcrR family transcriptional regulator n=1 Tax=Companilactobacillus sp. HBUAS56257 TaxID=3109360 RepID=UPI002FF1FB3C
MNRVFEDVDNWLNMKQMPKGKQKVIKAAMSLFSQYGYHATSTAMISKESQMSQATIFKYFKSKEELLQVIIKPMIEHILPTYGQDFVEEIKNNGGDLEELIRFMAYDRFYFLKQNKDAALILVAQTLIDDSIRNMLLEKIELFKKTFAKELWKSLQDTDELRDDVTLEDFIHVFVGQLVFYFIQSQRILVVDDEKILEKQLDKIIQNVILAIRKS